MLFRYLPVRCFVEPDSLPSGFRPADRLRIRAELVGGDRRWGPLAHGLQCFPQEPMRRRCVAPLRQHEVDQVAMRVDGAEQILSPATDLPIRLVNPPGGREVTPIPVPPRL